MRIIESWQDHNLNCYAIVRHSKKNQKKFGQKEYEPMWLDEMSLDKPELGSFGGSVGFTTADFDTIEEARAFLLKGISECDRNPEVWLEMVAV